jgi:hypothetical protein
MIAEAAASIPLLLYEGANEVEDHRHAMAEIAGSDGRFHRRIVRKG